MSEKRRALLSVTDKTGLVDLARVLRERGFDLVASGGTARALREADFPVLEVSELTGQPEILGGRVKTLHPAIHAGILAPRAEDLTGTGFDPIDVVVVNLYDFEGALRREAPEGELVEQIDIGGPTLLRAAAKNFERVTVLVEPSLYAEFARQMAENGGQTTRDFRRRCAAAVFSRTRDYDATISGGLFGESGGRPLRYGENPHQQATWSVQGGGDLGSLGLVLNGGKELSYNNLVDLVATLKLVGDLPADACAIVKHTNPCGVGRGESARAAFERALAGDPVSAFGGIVAFGRPVDGPCAELLGKRFLEVVAAPGYDEDARSILGAKKNLRWLDVDLDRFASSTRGTRRSWGRLVLSQDEDESFVAIDDWTRTAGDAPDERSRRAADLAWRVAKHVKSNAIVIADAEGTVGVGAGQMSRVDSCHLALRKARDAGLDPRGCAAASDGFFPFPDGLQVLAEAGVTTIVQPGGSIRDEEVAAAARELGVALLLTGRRHFRH